jgi:hypothetical protein
VIFGLAAQKEVANLTRPRRSAARFPLVENELLAMFKARRARGRKVSERWLCVNAKALAKQYYPAQEFKASHGWRQRFGRRAKIAPRRRTNAKTVSLAERLPQLMQWHRVERLMLTDATQGPIVDPKWGRFEPENRFNVDQVCTSCGVICLD